ncbi:FAD-binding oxidoreductase [Microbispora bryophytorum]|uniref:FAD-linked oxidase n=1 Tax=Microbispora bryophytorum TaxID=1460882 RepID=A0A8H9LCU9_9ACTN|nr:FAD-binding oxidoreductase [Microbispora bryophytorum]MBD3137868.1 FAD-binding oxidoreductase [Microbispora bryophytorum]TQS05608.1 FAD-binding oxidoreductase [Microbispora bryophytorum]GGO21411.1 FAD-linked oxidase [Microbispora bryophytorum]
MHSTIQDALRGQVTGRVLVPGQDGFEEEAAGFNLAVRHRPAVIVAARDAGDVAAAVRLAAAHGLPVAVQSTGHGAVQAADGAVLISTRAMREVVVDPSARTATIAAGCTWGEVIAAAVPYGLAPLCGSATGVGVAGFTLGGGIGPIARTFGFAADHVRELTVVTGDGVVRTADAVREPDLFWALRGGKAGFGVVTSITLDLLPLTGLYGGGLFYAAEDAGRVLHAYRGWAGTLPETTTTSVALLRLPPLPELPPQLSGRFVVHLRVAHVGDGQEAEALLAPMRAVAEPVLDAVEPLPYAAIDSIHQDPTQPMPVAERGALLRELTAETVEALLAVAGPAAQIPLAVVELRQLGGALARQPREPNAVGGREAAFTLLAIGAPVPELMDTAVPAAVRAVIEALAPWSTGGALINFQGGALAPEQISRAWPEETLRRLAKLREVYDPANLFRFGHVVPRQG